MSDAIEDLQVSAEVKTALRAIRDEVTAELVQVRALLRERDAQCAAMREALTKLRNEATAFLAVHESPGNTNIKVLKLRIEEATAALATDAGKAVMERLSGTETALHSAQERNADLSKQLMLMWDRVQMEKLVAEAHAQASAETKERCAKVADHHARLVNVPSLAELIRTIAAAIRAKAKGET